MKNQPEWEVEEILDSRVVDGKKEYLLKWKDFPPEESTWEPASSLKKSQKLLKLFKKAQKEKEEEKKKKEAAEKLEKEREAKELQEKEAERRRMAEEEAKKKDAAERLEKEKKAKELKEREAEWKRRAEEKEKEEAKRKEAAERLEKERKAKELKEREAERKRAAETLAKELQEREAERKRRAECFESEEEEKIGASNKKTKNQDSGKNIDPRDPRMRINFDPGDPDEPLDDERNDTIVKITVKNKDFFLWKVPPVAVDGRGVSIQKVQLNQVDFEGAKVVGHGHHKGDRFYQTQFKDGALLFVLDTIAKDKAPGAVRRYLENMFIANVV